MRSRRTQPRVGIEVVARQQRRRRTRAIGVEAHDAGDRPGRSGGVVLTNRVQPSPPFIECEIGVADVGRGTDGPGRAAAVLPVEALILEVGEPYRGGADQVGAAPILVDPGAY